MNTMQEMIVAEIGTIAATRLCTAAIKYGAGSNYVTIYFFREKGDPGPQYTPCYVAHTMMRFNETSMDVGEQRLSWMEWQQAFTLSYNDPNMFILLRDYLYRILPALKKK